MTPGLKCKGSFIDNNHSHFILVDDGTVGKYGGEIEWRVNLENCIAAQEIPRGKYVIDVSYCSNMQDAMRVKKKGYNRLAIASFHFVGKFFVVVSFCTEMWNPRVILILGKVGSSK